MRKASKSPASYAFDLKNETHVIDAEKEGKKKLAGKEFMVIKVTNCDI